ncbi:MAG: long-chain fatty acid--CoA ligase [Nocardioidaceae bacterium]|nr:MAG: long-chain fatty acid--CoA ligase [Nocardioidaceae bacterium]
MARQFFDRVAKSGDREAYRYPVGDTWQSLTWNQTAQKVTSLAAGLLALGVAPQQRVAIAASTRYEWILADLAILSAGAATTTVYPSTMSDDVAYILADSESRVVFAEDDTQIAKLVEHRSELPHLSKIVTFDGTPDGDWVISLADLEKLGDDLLATTPDAVEKVVAATQADDLATLIYTSGTTGRPKGVRLRHSSWTYEGAAIESLGILSEDDLQFLWLPLAHSFGKVLLSAQFACGFATAVDGRIDKIIDNLAVVKPTFMGAAPRIFEKAYARIQSMQEQEGGPKKKIFDTAFAVGTKVAKLKRDGKKVPAHLGMLNGLYDKLVFHKVRERFGGRVRFFISGSAALNREIAEWFDVAGIQILEGYGLTETSAGTFVNRPATNQFGTVGTPVPGTEVRIAQDGEVLVKGPGVMDGYHNLPEATAETIVDGWLYTGDIGELTPEGNLRITDRKKDLFKTSGGKYIAPSQIESRFKAINTFVGNIVVIGAERNYCSALITFDPDLLAAHAAAVGLEGKSYAELVNAPEIKTQVEADIEELNSDLNRWETIKKFVILDQDLTIESGELTPSMKVKRKVVEENNKTAIDELYQ